VRGWTPQSPLSVHHLLHDIYTYSIFPIWNFVDLWTLNQGFLYSKVHVGLGFLRFNIMGIVLSEPLNSWGSWVSENLNITWGMGLSESETLGVFVFWNSRARDDHGIRDSKSHGDIAVGLTPGSSSTVHIWLSPGGSSTVHIWLTSGGSSTVHIWLTPGGSSAVHIWLTPGGSSTAHIWLTPGGSSAVHIWLTPGGSSTAPHLHTNSTLNTENGTYKTIKKIWKCEPCPVFPSYTLAFSLRRREKQGNPSFSVVEKCPDPR
jgi:hypothetical protein